MQRKKRWMAGLTLGLMILLMCFPTFAALGSGEGSGGDDVSDGTVQAYDSFILVDFGPSGQLLEGSVLIEIEVDNLRYAKTFSKKDLLTYEEDRVVYQIYLRVKEDLQSHIEESKRSDLLGVAGKGRAVWTDKNGTVSELPWINFKLGEMSTYYLATLQYKMIGNNAADTGEWFEGSQRYIPLVDSADAQDANSPFNRQYTSRLETMVDQQVPATQTIRVFLDGALVAFDVPPQIVSGSTLVPVRALFEALGYQVAFESQTGRITASLDNEGVLETHIAMVLNNKTLEKMPDSETLRRTIEMPVAPLIVEGRTLIPLRAFSEAVGYDVQWNGLTRVITLKKAISQ